MFTGMEARMLKAQVKISGRYVIRVNGALTIVRVDRANGRWFQGTNERTGRTLRFTAAKLRRAV